MSSRHIRFLCYDRVVRIQNEATILQWNNLYEIATRIRNMKPWNKFNDTNHVKWTLITGKCIIWNVKCSSKQLPLLRLRAKHVVITINDLLFDLMDAPIRNRRR